MPSNKAYTQKFDSIVRHTLFAHLPAATQASVRKIAHHHRLTQQELRQIIEVAIDLNLWDSEPLETFWPDESKEVPEGKIVKKRLLQKLFQHWESLKASPNQYSKNKPTNPGINIDPIALEKGKLGLGYCPVASPKTRCCNLLTLDAVDNCGYGCSYCSIQSFFDGKQITFDQGFAEKLALLEVDPDKIYHIGTGQSSDSLMWGNSHGVLDALITFADNHPNVILEFKTKSANVSYLLKQKLPRNILSTWSLNTPDLIVHEEQGSASLEKRLQAARAVADQGTVVGFHFHPMIHYDRWREDYSELIEALTGMFLPHEVAMISLGTLTFTKPVIREIRKRGVETKILKLPLTEADGKLSYPESTKLEMFSHAYSCFPSQWQKEVFFYLCMENQRMWEPVFGFSYPSNDAFELAMKTAYHQKIQEYPNTC